MTEIFTAKTVEEAKALAAAKFGKDIKSIKFEVLDEGKKGFLGIGKTDAKVKATYVPEQTAAAQQSAKKAPVKAAEGKKTEAPKAAPAAAEAPKAEEKPAEAPVAEEAPKTE